MTSYVEIETEWDLPFEVESLMNLVGEAVLDMENCPYEAQVNLLITDNEGIHACNKEFRGIDRETDVLSFPALEFEICGDFSGVENDPCAFDPDSGELILGDIMISLEKAKKQAIEYGHSAKREVAFLIAHSMLHLCGYDHMTDEDAKVMEAKQEQVLQQLHITREGGTNG